MKVTLDIMDQCDAKIDHTKVHGPMILPYILKNIGWMNVILWIIDQCDTKIDLIKYL